MPGRGRVLLGATLVAAAGLMFALAGMGIKMAEESLSSFEVLFWRNVLSLAILTPWVVRHWPRSMRPAHRGLMAMRGIALVAALLCYYHAVSVLPLAEAVLLNFSSPIFVPVSGFPSVPIRARRPGAGGGADRLRGRRPDPQAGDGVLPVRGPDRARVGHARRALRRRNLAHAGRRGSVPHRRLLCAHRHSGDAYAGADEPDSCRRRKPGPA